LRSNVASTASRLAASFSTLLKQFVQLQPSQYTPDAKHSQYLNQKLQIKLGMSLQEIAQAYTAMFQNAGGICLCLEKTADWGDTRALGTNTQVWPTTGRAGRTSRYLTYTFLQFTSDQNNRTINLLLGKLHPYITNSDGYHPALIT
jgi:hypothetical protein